MIDLEISIKKYTSHYNTGRTLVYICNKDKHLISDIAMGNQQSSDPISIRDEARYHGTGTKADLDNHSNQCNPNNARYM